MKKEISFAIGNLYEKVFRHEIRIDKLERRNDMDEFEVYFKKQLVGTFSDVYKKIDELQKLTDRLIEQNDELLMKLKGE